MADGRILKIVNSPYLNETSSDSEEIWCTRADLELDNSHETKYENFKIQDVGRPSFFKISLFGHNSAADCPISVKFCKMKQFFSAFWQWDRYRHSTESIMGGLA